MTIRIPRPVVYAFGALLGAALGAGVALLVSGESDDATRTVTRTQRVTATTPTPEEAQVVRQVTLTAPTSSDAPTAAGIAIVAEKGGKVQLIVQAAGLLPSGEEEAYEVWLYNSPTDAKSLGAQVTDKRGAFQGAGRPGPLEQARK